MSVPAELCCKADEAVLICLLAADGRCLVAFQVIATEAAESCSSLEILKSQAVQGSVSICSYLHHKLLLSLFDAAHFCGHRVHSAIVLGSGIPEHVLPCTMHWLSLDRHRKLYVSGLLAGDDSADSGLSRCSESQHLCCVTQAIRSSLPFCQRPVVAFTLWPR